MGIIQAGCDVVGVDIDPRCKKHYPGKFVLHDALRIESLRELDGSRFVDQFDAFWASPKCEGNSRATKIRGNQADHVDQITPVRAMLQRIGKPYIIENVPEAESEHHRMRKDVELCGYMFGLQLERHRIFECSFPVAQPRHVPHGEIPKEKRQVCSVFGRLVSSKRKGGHERYLLEKQWRPVEMGIDHIPVNAGSSPDRETGKTYNLLALAIPPAFSKYLVEQCIAWIQAEKERGCVHE